MKTAKQLVKKGKHFCILPWIHFHAWPDKRVMPCCVADSDKPVSKLDTDKSILDVMNSDAYKEIRRKMLNDEYVDVCRRCFELEDNGIWTLRQSQNLVRGEDNIDLVELTNEDGSIDEFKLKYMDIRFSNLCNYKCRSCGPGCSNLWGEEEIKRVGEVDFYSKFGTKKTLISNNEDGDFMPKLKPYLADVEEVYFAGGEIIVTPEHYECLDYWVEHGLTEQVKLNYTTNMSKLKYKKWDLFKYWKQFPNMEIWASLDAMGEVAELIRSGTQWERVEENLRAIRTECPHIKLQITPTISIWNIFEYSKLFDYLYDNDLVCDDQAPRVNILTYPAHAAIGILPDHIRARLAKHYKEYEKRFDGFEKDPRRKHESIRNGFRAIAHALEQGKENRELLKTFFADQAVVDRVRSENIMDVIPDLVEVYEWTRG